MAENDEHPFANVLTPITDKFANMPRAKLRDERTSATVLAELEENNRRSAELLSEFRALRRKETEHLGKSSQEILNALQLRGD